jgi:Short-chain alcohol dehydrogenase of unknown specificity
LVEGKTCIVTGGAGSIGLATVRTLLAEGAKVMLVDLDADKLARTVRELGTDKRPSSRPMSPTLLRRAAMSTRLSRAGARSTCCSRTPATTAR